MQASPGTIYDQLERVTTELRELKVQHQQLQSKNLLLEKCLRLEHSQKLRQTSREVCLCISHGGTRISIHKFFTSWYAHMHPQG